jgi:transcription termination factor Rho
MDEVIFEEFKGTGNMELHSTAAWRTGESGPLSTSTLRHAPRGVAAGGGGTRRVWLLRALSGMNPAEAMEVLLGRLKQSRQRRFSDGPATARTVAAGFIELSARSGSKGRVP